MDQFEQYSLRRLIKLIWLIAIILVSILITIIMSSFGSAQYSINDQQSLVASTSTTSNNTITVNNSACWLGICTNSDFARLSGSQDFLGYNSFLQGIIVYITGDLGFQLTDGSHTVNIAVNESILGDQLIYLPPRTGDSIDVLATIDDLENLTTINPFNQHLNTTSSVQFNDLSVLNTTGGKNFIRVGRTSSENLRLAMDDTEGYFNFTQDTDEGSAHNMFFDTSIAGTNATKFNWIWKINGTEVFRKNITTISTNRNVSFSDWIFGNKLLLSLTGTAVFSSTNFQVTTQDVGSGLISLSVIKMVGGAGILAGAIANALWVLPETNAQASQFMLIKDAIASDSWLFQNNNNTGNLELNRLDPISGTPIKGQFNITGNLSISNYLRASNYSSANGTLGFTGTCTNKTLSIENGLIVGCS